jgi:hypothetical protein
LTAASTPLAGTEVLPIVQSSATVQVSVANLTAGRTQTSNGIVQGTAATGYNFTANTPAAGMTSQLLNWYEEGTWTPAGNGITFSSASGTYTRIGRLVTASFTVTFPVTANTSNAQATGLPFTAGANSAVALSGYNSDLNAQVNSATSLIYFANASGAAYKTNANLSTQIITGTVSYRV